jgi:ADP-ribose pyrophosphatase YjhB (NUDIX family)
MECQIHKLVADIAVLADDHVVLVRYRDTGAYDGQRGWFVPDDFLSHGEHPEEAARRIAREQIGLELSRVRLSYVESFANGAWHLIFHYVSDLDEMPTISPGENVDAHEWFGLQDLPPAEETAHEGWTLEIVAGALGGRAEIATHPKE